MKLISPEGDRLRESLIVRTAPVAKSIAVPTSSRPISPAMFVPNKCTSVVPFAKISSFVAAAFPSTVQFVNVNSLWSEHEIPPALFALFDSTTVFVIVIAQ